MSRWPNSVRAPVRRLRAERYLTLTLVSFSLSVMVTRLLLYLTGYPQLGAGPLHIAHVLWGGMLLFAAALLPLLWANRWVYTTGALLAGVGVGLFIDEVGKFITQNNDYFHPAAAPIIYAFFLLTALLLLQVRRTPTGGPRLDLYHALESLEEVLEHDLEPDEHRDLMERLDRASRAATQPDLARLAGYLLAFLHDEKICLAPAAPDVWERTMRSWRAFEIRWLPRRRLRVLAVLGLAGLGAAALVQLGTLLIAVRSPEALARAVENLVRLGRVSGSVGLGWFLARVALEGTVGLLLWVAAVFIVAGREHGGFRLGALALLLSLTTVDLLLFYFEQFSTFGLAALQALLLLGVWHYQRRYLNPAAMRRRRISETRQA